jgi:hypothetical protein
MESFLASRRILIKDFKRFAPAQAERLKEYAKAMAEKQGRPYIYLDRKTPKEEQARWLGHPTYFSTNARWARSQTCALRCKARLSRSLSDKRRNASICMR